ncbi:hypothetical protein HAL013_15050 [Helicobacter ailurogastricus]|uniref:Uncharacterized protein n=1 Tax=Helicobacter ailurogastricus TaxID=1578720 RepID=A0A0K2XCI8_9HELI|nr:hypothetical protein HAL011_13730 [Helicobacter ailurogastricus]CRF43278.1 hypothetical protein HAL013_15050 [Helicobacter ailurogastricus]
MEADRVVHRPATIKAEIPSLKDCMLILCKKKYNFMLATFVNLV